MIFFVEGAKHGEHIEQLWSRNSIACLAPTNTTCWPGRHCVDSWGSKGLPPEAISQPAISVVR